MRMIIKNSLQDVSVHFFKWCGLSQLTVSDKKRYEKEI